MAKYRISHDAQADIVDILRFTHNRFGDAARRRYQALIGAALEAVATDPQQVGSISREELGAGLRSIHLVYCRSMPNVSKVVRPRHFVFYRVATDQVLSRWFACFTTPWIWINTCLATDDFQAEYQLRFIRRAASHPAPDAPPRPNRCLYVDDPRAKQSNVGNTGG